MTDLVPALSARAAILRIREEQSLAVWHGRYVMQREN